MSAAKKVKVLFVCMGNICRSPTAHGIFRKMIQDEGLSDQVEIDSAGTHAYHVGNPPDLRTKETAQKYGYDLSDLRARKVDHGDLIEYDYVIAMDMSNLHNLMELVTDESQKDKISLFLDFSEDFKGQEVPDPYYGGQDGFERVFKLVTSASEGLIADIRTRLAS